MIKIVNLTQVFGKQKVLDRVDLEVPDGQKLAIIGPSGCGKSTFLRLLVRLMDPTGGFIFIDGKDITLLNEEELIKIRRKIGFVFQTSALFDSLTIFENVAFGLRQLENFSEDEIRRKVMEKLSLVNLHHVEDLMPSELSGGMQKRVGLARAIATDPKIILYDEPTTGLDPITSTTIEDLINKLARELKVTSIIVTHQMSTVYRTCDRIIMLHEGHFTETGDPKQTQNTKDRVVREFIKGGAS